MGSTRTFVLDTSVLLADPTALTGFAEHDVVVPEVVITELEAKRGDALLGYNARTALRALEQLRVEHGTALTQGVPHGPHGGTVRVEVNHVSTDHLPVAAGRYPLNADMRILVVAHNLTREGHQVTVVTKDLPLRLRAQVLFGLHAEEYLREQAKDTGYTGLCELDVPDDVVAAVHDNPQGIEPWDVEAKQVPCNTGVLLRSFGTQATAIAIRGPQRFRIVRSPDLFELRPRGWQQRIAFDHLTNPDIGVVSLGGPAGTGKTALALAAALQLVLEDPSTPQQRIVVYRNLHMVGGQDIGYLPGTMEEKMHPAAQAVYDALESLAPNLPIDDVRARTRLEIEPLSFIRGRSLRDTVMIVEEAQNLELNVLLTVLSRAGEGSKVILTSDVDQRDNLRVGRHDGIAALVNRLAGESLFAHVTLSKVERSAIAAMLARTMAAHEEVVW